MTALRPRKNRRRAAWCTTHEELAWLYEDGSTSCMWELVVEARSDDCVLVAIPKDQT